MSKIRRRIMRLILAGAAAVAFVGGPVAVLTFSAPPVSAQPCYNGVVPWGPYIPSCTLPGPQGAKVPGSAPDANAIIACRNHPGCLSWYVNGP